MFYLSAFGMRLLDTKTGQFVDRKPDTDIYAILSHTWVPEGEQSYEDLQAIQRDYGPDGLRLPSSVSCPPAPSSWLLSTTNSQFPQSIWDDPRLSPKIRCACETARKADFRYIWIDSCCIDKKSSSEVSEAIGSMYKWYREARICFAFLADVPPFRPDQSLDFKKSRWFTRGWTLQELLAPDEVAFLSGEWTYLGTKYSQASLIYEITGIDQAVLKNEISLDRISVAKRMSWASKRETTKPEDEAYSLLGIFDIFLTPAYGEGRRAFRRLQEEILKRIPDQSIFAWGNTPTCAVFAPFDLHPNTSEPSQYAGVTLDCTTAASANGGDQDQPPFLCSAERPSLPNFKSLFATSPRDFRASHSVDAIVDCSCFKALLGGGIDVPAPDYTLCPDGIRTQFPLLPLSNKAAVRTEDHGYFMAILACTDERREGMGLLGRLCVLRPGHSASPNIHHLHATSIQMRLGANPCGLFVLPHPQDPTAPRPSLFRHISMRTVYLPHPSREPSLYEDKEPPRDLGTEGSIKVRFPEWAADRLRAQGYRVNVIPQIQHGSRTDHSLINISKGEDALAFAYKYWTYTRIDPRGELRFVVNICRFERQSHCSRASPAYQTRPTVKVVFRSVIGLRATCGQRSCNHLVRLPSESGSRLALRIGLELVSGSCYHLQLSIESDDSDTRASDDHNSITTDSRGPGIRTGALQDAEQGVRRVPTGGTSPRRLPVAARRLRKAASYSRPHRNNMLSISPSYLIPAIER